MRNFYLKLSSIMKFNLVELFISNSSDNFKKDIYFLMQIQKIIFYIGLIFFYIFGFLSSSSLIINFGSIQSIIVLTWIWGSIGFYLCFYPISKLILGRYAFNLFKLELNDNVTYKNFIVKEKIFIDKKIFLPLKKQPVIENDKKQSTPKKSKGWFRRIFWF